MSVGWNLNDSITFRLPNTSFLFFSKMIVIHQNVSHCQNTLTLLTPRWRIFPAMSVGGLPISQDRLDILKFVHNRTIPIILPSGKNILGNMVFKISVGYTNLDTRQIQSRLGSRVCLFIAPKESLLAYIRKQSIHFFFWLMIPPPPPCLLDKLFKIQSFVKYWLAIVINCLQCIGIAGILFTKLTFTYVITEKTKKHSSS